MGNASVFKIEHTGNIEDGATQPLLDPDDPNFLVELTKHDCNNFMSLLLQFQTADQEKQTEMRRQIMHNFLTAEEDLQLKICQQILHTYRELPEETKDAIPELVKTSIKTFGAMNDESALCVVQELVRQINAFEESEQEEGEGSGGVQLTKKIAYAVARVETKQLGNWIKQGPFTLRVLGFITGIILCLSGFVEFWIFISEAHVHAALVNAYCIFFGIMIMFIEVQTLAFARQQKVLNESFSFLNNSYCRVIFYLFCGTLTSPEWDWKASLDDASAILCFLMAFLQLLFTRLAIWKLSKLELSNKKIASEKFEEFDLDGNGTLDAVELSKLVESLGSLLNRNELEAALILLDANGDRLIEKEDFIRWFSEYTFI